MIPRKTLEEILNALPLDKNQRKDLQYYIEHSADKIPFNYKLEDYLHYIQINNYDYNYANEFFEALYSVKVSHIKQNSFACSAAKYGQFLIRNYDWNYTDEVEFLIHVPKSKNHFASIGVATNIGVTDEMIAEHNFNNKLDILPFFTTCGINENGVSVSINVVPKDFGKTSQYTHHKRMSAIMIPRYVLDNATSARQIVEDLAVNFNFYCTPSYEFHFIIADKNDTFVIEFINNQTVIIDNNIVSARPFITNFHIYNMRTIDNKVDYDSIEMYGQGVERYEDMWDFITHNNPTFENAARLLQNLKFTNAYTNNRWLTEFTGWHNLTVQDSKYRPHAYDEILRLAKHEYIHRKRDGKTWQTMHSTCYDLINKKMYIGVQEQPLRYCFECEHNLI